MLLGEDLKTAGGSQVSLPQTFLTSCSVPWDRKSPPPPGANDIKELKKILLEQQQLRVLGSKFVVLGLIPPPCQPLQGWPGETQTPRSGSGWQLLPITCPPKKNRSPEAKGKVKSKRYGICHMKTVPRLPSPQGTKFSGRSTILNKYNTYSQPREGINNIKQKQEVIKRSRKKNINMEKRIMIDGTCTQMFLAGWTVAGRGRHPLASVTGEGVSQP